MANPNVDKLYAKYSNLTERFIDRLQQLVDGARSGDLNAAEVGGAAAEAMMDGIDAVSAPWLMVLDGDLTFNKALPSFRVVIDGAKADRTKRTRLKLDTGVTLGAQKLVNVDDPSKEIPVTHVEPKKSGATPPRLLVKLKNLGSVTGAPEGVYEGNILDTTSGSKPIAKLIVEWPG